MKMSNIIKNRKRSKHILDLTMEEKQKFLDSFDIILSDCDGVIWNVAQPISNTGEAINLLKQKGKSFKFVTNNDGMRSNDDYVKKASGIGARNIMKNDFILPFKAFARHFKLKYPNEICYCIGTRIFSQSLSECGITVKNITPGFNLTPYELNAAVTPIDDAKVIAVSIHVNMTLPEFALIHQYLCKDNCVVCINAVDDRFPISDRLTMVGPGPFLQSLCEITGNVLKVFGKPSNLIAEYMVDEFRIVDRKRGIFVGGNLVADIKFGINQGFQTLFVLSGANSMEDMILLPPECQPDYYANGLGDFVKFFDNLREHEDFLIPYKAIAKYVKSNFPGEICYCLSSETFQKSLQGLGLKTINASPPFDTTFQTLARATTPSLNAKVVIFDFHLQTTWLEMAVVHQYMEKKDCAVFVNELDDRAPISEDLILLGPGHFINSIVSSRGKEMIVVGKPGEIMGEFLVNEFPNVERNRRLFFGDNLFVDVKFAIEYGFQSLLVLSGAHTKEDMLQQPYEFQPDYYADTLGDFVEFFKDVNI
ncbi:uncharacterized protein LOC142231051 [Haematobia irritans]|uniref:uncharacterized protein LOC142231051 n=1 Tax=Haematobia irritans TaxID=7368 RepID=UPI003F508F3F